MLQCFKYPDFLHNSPANPGLKRTPRGMNRYTARICNVQLQTLNQTYSIHSRVLSWLYTRKGDGVGAVLTSHQTETGSCFSSPPCSSILVPRNTQSNSVHRGLIVCTANGHPSQPSEQTMILQSNPPFAVLTPTENVFLLTTFTANLVQLPFSKASLTSPHAPLWKQMVHW